MAILAGVKERFERYSYQQRWGESLQVPTTLLQKLKRHTAWQSVLGLIVFCLTVVNLIITNALLSKDALKIQNQCPKDWELHGDACYQLLSGSYHRAQLACRGSHPEADLAVFRDKKDFNDFFKLRDGLEWKKWKESWINGIRVQMNDNWKIETASETCNLTDNFVRWGPGEPNNYLGNEDCLLLGIRSKLNNDAPCDWDMQAICQIPFFSVCRQRNDVIDHDIILVNHLEEATIQKPPIIFGSLLYQKVFTMGGCTSYVTVFVVLSAQFGILGFGYINCFFQLSNFCGLLMHRHPYSSHILLYHGLLACGYFISMILCAALVTLCLRYVLWLYQLVTSVCYKSPSFSIDDIQAKPPNALSRGGMPLILRIFLVTNIICGSVTIIGVSLVISFCYATISLEYSSHLIRSIDATLISISVMHGILIFIYTMLKPSGSLSPKGTTILSVLTSCTGIALATKMGLIVTLVSQYQNVSTGIVHGISSLIVFLAAVTLASGILQVGLNFAELIRACLEQVNSNENDSIAHQPLVEKKEENQEIEPEDSNDYCL